MEQPIELIGVDSDDGSDEPKGGDNDEQLPGVARTATVQRSGLGGTGRQAGAAVAILTLLAVLVLREPASETPEQLVEQERVAQVETPTTNGTTPRAAPVGGTTPRFHPVAAAASGITLVVGRGVEKTFIDLDTGKKMVVDVDGEPVAGISGYLALAIDHDGSGTETCWFSLADRRCGADPTLLTGGSSADAPWIHVFDPLEVRSLTAATQDERWIAGWRFGQLVVTDQTTGEDSVVHGVQRSYFDDAMALIG